MTPDAGTLRIITRWIDAIAKMTRHKQGKLTTEEAEDLKDERALVVTMLGKDFPSGAFTTDSLHAVLQGQTFFPPYEHIRSTVAAWWAQHCPNGALALPDESGGGARLTGMDRHWFDFWHKRRAEGFGPEGGGSTSSAKHIASLVRSQSPAAWAAISGEADRGTLQRQPPTQEVIDQVAQLLHPEPQQGATVHTRPAPVRDPMPDVSLSGEDLRRSREKRGLPVPPRDEGLSEAETFGLDGEPPPDLSAWH